MNLEMFKRASIGTQGSVFNVRAREYRDNDRKDYRVYNNEKKKFGIFKPLIGYNKKGKLTRHDASDYGELLAYELAKKTGIPVCEVELAVKREQIPHKNAPVDLDGAVSYVDLVPGEVLTLSMEIVEYFRLNHYDEYKEILAANKPVKESDLDQHSERFNNNVEVVIPAFLAYVKDKFPKATKKELEALKQSLIDMVVFDCRFANSDRNDENFGLRISKDGSKFYPIFDNEQILGFHESTEFIEANSGASLQEHIDRQLVSRMGVTSKPINLGYSAMMTYMFTTYPVETYRAYQKVMSVKDTELTELMERCGSDLDDIHKAYALRIFKSREKGFELIKDSYIDAKGRPINNNPLPGNKPMEIAPRSSLNGSPGRKAKTPKTPHTLDD